MNRVASTTESIEHGMGGQLKTPQGKILIVDDEPSLRRVLRTTLAVHGFEIVEASTGEEALVLVGTGRCDVVLLDIDMPGIGGMEACRELRRRDPCLQIMILSVRDREEDKVKAFDAGADDYVAKPFSVSEFLARLRAAVRRSKAMSGRTHQAPENAGARF
jgi:two-component system KDP operon response regulator KdpE